jgi:hypothetical protein
MPAAFAAEADPLRPAEATYENGNIVLSKQANRVGPDEWEVTVRATIKEAPIVRQNMEVVIVLDASGSMHYCTDESKHVSHSKHTSSCYGIVCGKEEHSHKESLGCYDYTCGKVAHTHSDACQGAVCGNVEHMHQHTTSECYTKCNKSNHYYTLCTNNYRCSRMRHEIRFYSR